MTAYRRVVWDEPPVTIRETRTFVLDESAGKVFFYDNKAVALIDACRGSPTCIVKFGARIVEIAPNSGPTDITTINRETGEISSWYWRFRATPHESVDIRFDGTCKATTMPSLTAQRKF